MQRQSKQTVGRARGEGGARGRKPTAQGWMVSGRRRRPPLGERGGRTESEEEEEEIGLTQFHLEHNTTTCCSHPQTDGPTARPPGRPSAYAPPLGPTGPGRPAGRARAIGVSRSIEPPSPAKNQFGVSIVPRRTDADGRTGGHNEIEEGGAPILTMHASHCYCGNC